MNINCNLLALFNTFNLYCFLFQHKLETSEANRRNLLKRLEKEKDQVQIDSVNT
jgi:hypothetical protein